MVKFSSDGKTFDPTSGLNLTFDKATDENTADYVVTASGTKYTYTFITTDGKTGSYKINGQSSGAVTLTK